MKPDINLDRVDALFARAVRLPPEQRQGFLSDACEDDLALFAAIEERLVRHDWAAEHGGSSSSSRADGLDLIHDHADVATCSQSDTGCSGSSGPSVGQRFGRFNLLSILGQGGNGIVYLAEDILLERSVALKLPWRDRFHSDRDVQCYLDEARALAKLKHPGIVSLYDVQSIDDYPVVLVMEYVEGNSVHVRLKHDGVNRRDALDLLAQVAEAVHFAHQQGFVHRDLKPSNVLISREGVPRVADFGLAIHETSQRARAGERAGTFPYMAPEQVRGEAHRLDGRTDIWALGVMLYEVLTHRRPFTGATPNDLCDEILNREPKPLRQIDETISPGLEELCLKCLSKSVNGRFTTAADVADRLRSLRECEDEHTSVTTPSTTKNGLHTLVAQASIGRLGCGLTVTLMSLLLIATLPLMRFSESPQPRITTTAKSPHDPAPIDTAKRDPRTHTDDAKTSIVKTAPPKVATQTNDPDDQVVAQVKRPDPSNSGEDRDVRKDVASTTPAISVINPPQPPETNRDSLTENSLPPPVISAEERLQATHTKPEPRRPGDAKDDAPGIDRGVEHDAENFADRGNDTGRSTDSVPLVWDTKMEKYSAILPLTLNQDVYRIRAKLPEGVSPIGIICDIGITGTVLSDQRQASGAESGENVLGALRKRDNIDVMFADSVFKGPSNLVGNRTTPTYDFDCGINIKTQRNKDAAQVEIRVGYVLPSGDMEGLTWAKLRRKQRILVQNIARSARFRRDVESLTLERSTLSGSKADTDVDLVRINARLSGIDRQIDRLERFADREEEFRRDLVAFQILEEYLKTKVDGCQVYVHFHQNGETVPVDMERLKRSHVRPIKVFDEPSVQPAENQRSDSR